MKDLKALKEIEVILNKYGYDLISFSCEFPAIKLSAGNLGNKNKDN
jgi:hypothetical protein